MNRNGISFLTLARLLYQHLIKVTALVLIPILFPYLVLGPKLSFALPQDYSVESGNASFVTSDDHLTLTINAGDNAIINFGSFNIGQNETVNFVQGGLTSSVLSRVTGGASSDIFGSLFSNGQLVLVNANGINFHDTANVQVGSLIASTLDIQSSLFANNQLTFEKMNPAIFSEIRNEGSITAVDGGSVALLSDRIVNTGTLTANLGSVVLGVGEKQTLSFDNNGLINLVVDRGLSGFSEDTAIGIENTGLLRAQGGRVNLSVKTLNDVLNTLINTTGIIEATGVEMRDGEIIFSANGAVEVSGSLETDNLMISQGTHLHANDSKLHIFKDWINQGVFSGEQSEVELKGAADAHVTGDNQFHDLTIKAPSKKIYFEAGKTQTIDGLFKVQGAYGEHVRLLSSDADAVWYIDPSGQRDISYAWVEDSHNLSAEKIMMTESTNRDASFMWDPRGIWTGANSALWSDALNWTGLGGATPGGGDDVVFDSGNAASTIDQDFFINSLTINGYVGTLTQSANLYITTDFSQATGTFTASNPSTSTFYAGGNFYIPGGTFNRFGGLGTGISPYLIYDVYALQAMNQHLSSTYRLANNIDASLTSGWNQGSGWMPIGMGSSFTGTFNGQNYVISNLSINRPSQDFVGFFSRLDGSTVQNVGFTNLSVTGHEQVGGVASQQYNSATLQNVYATGSVTGTFDDNTGGLLGYSDTSTIDGSHFSGTVSGNTGTGGLAGYVQGGTVSNSYSTGSASGSTSTGGLLGGTGGSAVVSKSYSTASVSGGSYAGGLVGAHQQSSSISDSYATGAVTGTGFVGGLIGANFDSSVARSYSTGFVSAAGNVGGFAGFDSGASSYSDNYWDITVNPTRNDIGAANVGGVSSLTTAQMRQQSNFTGFNFTLGSGDWIMAGTPHLPAIEYSTTVTNVIQLQMMNWDLSAAYTIANNIDASSTANWNWNGATYDGFMPLGNNGTKFTGTLNGGNFAISGLTINRGTTDYVGLFGYTNGATISNLGLTGLSISGQSNVGGLAGRLDSTNVSNSYTSGSVTSSAFSSYVGGFAGRFNLGSITGSRSAGTVTTPASSMYRGGFLGYMDDGTIGTSYSTSSLPVGTSGGSYGGGFVGLFMGGTISDSYASGSISGNDTVGGFVGAAGTGTISRAFASGTVSDTGAGGNYIGGFAGAIFLNASISDSYARGAINIDDGTDNVGGFTGSINSGSLVRSYSGSVMSIGAGSTTIGGFIGNYGGAPTLTNNYWDTVLTGQATSGGQGAGAVTGLTTQNMTDSANFTGWDISNSSSHTWIMTGAPHLQMEASSSITNVYQLQMMKLNLAGNYALANDIDASGTSSWNWGGAAYAGFNPVGDSGTKFTGQLNGNNYVISGLTINRPTTNDVGLLGYTNNASVSNLGLAGVNITGQVETGGLIGRTNTTPISNSYVTGTVTGTNYTGGLVGYNVTSNISDSYSGATVTGLDYTGGLAGYSYTVSNITNSYATGNVSGQNYVGGLIGKNEYFGTISSSFATGNVTASGSAVGGLLGESFYSSVSNSYALGNVSGVAQVGGFIGNDNPNFSPFSSVNNNYSAGAVSGSAIVGGFVGQWSFFQRYSNNFWNSTVNGGLSDTGSGNQNNIAPLTSAQMLSSANFSGYDFSNSWGMAEGLSTPFLRTQPVIAGKVYQDAGVTTLAGVNVALLVNGASVAADRVTDANGTYIFRLNSKIASGKSMVLYINGDATYHGNTVSVSNGGAGVGMDIYGNDTVIARTESSQVTNANFSAAKGGSADTDILYSVAGSDLSLAASTDLLVWAGSTFTPGGNVSTRNLSIRTGSTLDIANYNLTLGGGATFDNLGTLKLYGGTQTISNLTMDTNSGAVWYTGPGSYSGLKLGNTYYDLLFTGGGTYTLGANLTVNHDVTLSSGTLDLSGRNFTVSGAFDNYGTVRFKGNETFSSSKMDSDSGTWTIYGTTAGSDTIALTNLGDVYNFTVDASGDTISAAATAVWNVNGYLIIRNGTLNRGNETTNVTGKTTVLGALTIGDATFSNDLQIYGGSVTSSASADLALNGSLVMDSGSFTAPAVGHSLTVLGDWSKTGGTFTENGGTVTFDGTGSIAGNFNNVVLNSGSRTLASALDINGALTLTAGSLDVSALNYQMNVAGNWNDTGAASFIERSGTVVFDGTGNLNSNEAFNSITVSAGTRTLSQALDVNGNLTLSGTGVLDVSASNYQINVAGSWIDTGAGSFTERNGTVVFDGTGNINSNEAFNNLTINTGGTLTLSQTLDVNGNLSLAGGTLDVSASNRQINLAGNWNKTTGTFNQRSGVVLLDGTNQSIFGDNTFFRLTKTATGLDTLSFENGKTQTIQSNLSLQGQSAGNELTLQSTTPGSQWTLAPNAAAVNTFNFLKVKDSVRLNSLPLSPANVANLGNTSGWFNPVPSAASGADPLSEGIVARQQTVLKPNPPVETTGLAGLVGDLQAEVGDAEGLYRQQPEEDSEDVDKKDIAQTEVEKTGVPVSGQKISDSPLSDNTKNIHSNEPAVKSGLTKSRLNVEVTEGAVNVNGQMVYDGEKAQVKSSINKAKNTTSSETTLQMRSLYVMTKDGLDVVRAKVHKSLKSFHSRESSVSMVSSPKSDKVYLFSQDGKISSVDTNSFVSQGKSLLSEGTSDAKLSPDESKAYAVNGMNDTIEVLDLKTSKTTSLDSHGPMPLEAVLNRDGGNIFVSNTLSGTVSKIDTKTGNLLGSFNAGKQPLGLHLSKDEKTLYVADYQEGVVRALNTQTGAEKGKISVGQGAYSVKASPDESLLLVSNRNDNSVSVIDLSSFKQRSKIAVGERPMGISFTPEGNKAYVANQLSSSLSLIDLKTDKVLENIPTGTAPSDVMIGMHKTNSTQNN